MEPASSETPFPAPGNPLTPRFYAMTHIAMFDAINAIEREFEPYRVRLRPWVGGSPTPRPRRPLTTCSWRSIPSAAATYDAALAADLGDHPSGFVRRGAEIGARVAKEILAWRQNDGWIVSPFPPYAEPLLPGRWQPTPPANAAAAFTHLQHAAPMAVLSATQFLPSPPPSLTSARYAADLNEVKLLGKSDSAARTDEQTTIARLWSGVGTTTGFFSVWNNVARDVVQARHLSLVEAARVFVLVNVSIHDALQTTQASKFVYGVWRPVTAIRAADTDLNRRHRSRSDVAAPDHHAAVSVVCRQPGDDRGQRGARAPARLRHERHARGRDLEAARRAARCHAALRRVLGGRRRRGDGPHLRRRSLPLRSGGRPAGRPLGRRVRVRELHAAAGRFRLKTRRGYLATPVAGLAPWLAKSSVWIGIRGGHMLRKSFDVSRVRGQQVVTVAVLTALFSGAPGNARILSAVRDSPILVSDVEELYEVVNDAANAGAAVALAPGLYTLAETDAGGAPRPNRGRLELKADMSLMASPRRSRRRRH